MATQNNPLLNKYAALRSKLNHALLVDAHAGELLHQLKNLVKPPKSVLPKNLVALAGPRVELALAWFPDNIPLTLHLACNGKPVRTAGTIFSGAMQFIPIPADCLRDDGNDNELIASLSFLAGGWKYQLWIDIDGERLLLDEGKDADPGSPSNDWFVKTLKFKVA